MREEFGSITKFPALFGRAEMCMTFSVSDAEKLFRFEGQFPFRRTLETLDHYRKKVRPDVYEEYGSLLSE
jgi:cytochrome P450 family 12